MARAFDSTQASRSVPGRDSGMRAAPRRKLPLMAAICVWVALSWLLVGLVVAGVWRVLT